VYGKGGSCAWTRSRVCIDKEPRVYGQGGTCVPLVPRHKYGEGGTCLPHASPHALKNAHSRHSAHGVTRDSKTRRTVSHSELNVYRSNVHGAQPLSRGLALERRLEPHATMYSRLVPANLSLVYTRELLNDSSSCCFISFSTSSLHSATS